MTADSPALDRMDAKLFVDGPESARTLVEDLAQLLGGGVDGSWVTGGSFALNVDGNDDLDPDRRWLRPDGFLHFALLVEVYFSPSCAIEERAQLVGRVLAHLWEQGVAAVAASDYEDALPHAGGVAEPSLPWPAPPAPIGP